ncbi:MAG TPA: glycosyltransferase family 4 protein [Burkholderiales bacterium]
MGDQRVVAAPGRGVTAGRSRYVVLLGTSCDTRGGVAAVIASHLAAGLAERWPLVHLATHGDGGRWTKLRLAGAALIRFLGMLVADRVGLVHVHSASDASFMRKAAFIALALAARRPVIFHLHGGGFFEFYRDRCGPLRRRLVRFLLDRVDHIVMLSEQGARRLAGITANPRVSVIPNMVDMRAFRRSSPRQPGDAELLFLGRLDAAKGVEELLQAAAKLRARFPRLRLVLAGAGDARAIEARATALGVADAIELPGWVVGEQKQALLERASVFVLPSHVENMPVSVLEAMAAGVPVVATTVGAIPEVVEHGVTGLLVPPRDANALARAIETILADAQQCQRMAEAGRTRAARHYSVDCVMPRLEAIYREFCSRRRSPARA